MTELKVLTAEEQVANILSADARRVRRLTWATIGLWGLTVLLTAVVATAFLHHHRYAANAASRYWSERNDAEIDPHEADRAALARVMMLDMYLHVGGGLLAIAVILLAAASLGTVLLVHASRRATLRQIQASLSAIAEQLAEIQRGRNMIPPTASG